MVPWGQVEQKATPAGLYVPAVQLDGEVTSVQSIPTGQGSHVLGAEL